MKKIIEYDILSSGTPNQLILKVNGAINFGWQPYGPMSVPVGPNLSAYHQAMVRYEE